MNDNKLWVVYVSMPYGPWNAAFSFDPASGVPLSEISDINKARCRLRVTLYKQLSRLYKQTWHAMTDCINKLDSFHRESSEFIMIYHGHVSLKSGDHNLILFEQFDSKNNWRLDFIEFTCQSWPLYFCRPNFW